MKVSENMLKWRSHYRYKQGIPAAELGINQQSYSKKEQGKVKLKPEEGLKLAQFYHAPVSDFCEEEGTSAPLPERERELLLQLIASKDTIIEKDKNEREVLKGFVLRLLSGKVSKRDAEWMRGVVERMGD